MEASHDRAADSAHAAGASRDTAERLLPKLHARWLRAMTGRGRWGSERAG